MKLDEFEDAALAGPVFRGCAATAPLKQLQPCPSANQIVGVPWLTSHGPIDESTLCRSRRYHCPLRGFRAAATLKSESDSELWKTVDNYLGETATATLKLAQALPDLHISGPFRGCEATASLKHVTFLRKY